MKLPIAVIVVAALLVACQNPVCACSPDVHQILFMGSVARSTGPITDAQVVATLAGDDCRFAAPTLDSPYRDSVNAAGHYELVVYRYQPGSFCARLVASWPSDSAVRDSILVVAPSPNAIVVDFAVP